MKDWDQLLACWYADVYDQNENHTNDVEYLLRLLCKPPQRILEAAIGTGRISIPLAKAGYDVTGFDKNEAMLARIAPKIADCPGLSLRWRHMDAVEEPWGEDFDACVLYGNLLFNVESDLPYEQTQRLFVSRAYDCLRPGGKAYFDFWCFDDVHDEENPDERVIFEGTDADGVYGQFTIFGNREDAQARMMTGTRHFRLRASDGETFETQEQFCKYMPDMQSVRSWLSDAGFVLEGAYTGYSLQPFTTGNSRIHIVAGRPN